MQTIKNDMLTEINRYYSSKLALHGETAKGVDWNGEESQILRFDQLNKLITTQAPFSINDLGCGYGAFYDYLSEIYESFSYTGIDISEDMIGAAKLRYSGNANTDFIIANEPQKIADYAVASGVLNVRLQRSDEEWLSYIEMILDLMHQFSHLGFAFNCLTSYSDREKMKDYLYYADPCVLFDLCKQRYSPHVTILHDYGLYEFTILVRKVL